MEGEKMKTWYEFERLDLYNKALNAYGINAQLWVLIEEMAELANEVAKLMRERSGKQEIITELADVKIMVEQIAFFFGYNEVNVEMHRKLERLEERIKNHKQNQNHEKVN